MLKRTSGRTRKKIFYKDSEGNEKSYNPRRYECDYEFNITIHVDSPWFDEIELELSDGNRPDSRFTDLYREYEQKMHELADILMRRDNCHRVFDGDGMMNQIRAEDELFRLRTSSPTERQGMGLPFLRRQRLSALNSATTAEL